jgi:hypothetical protein
VWFLDRQVGGEWRAEFYLLADRDAACANCPSAASATSSLSSFEQVMVSDAGPDALVLPEKAEPGRFRLCTQVEGKRGACALLDVVDEEPRIPPLRFADDEIEICGEPVSFTADVPVTPREELTVRIVRSTGFPHEIGGGAGLVVGSKERTLKGGIAVGRFYDTPRIVTHPVKPGQHIVRVERRDEIIAVGRIRVLLEEPGTPTNCHSGAGDIGPSVAAQSGAPRLVTQPQRANGYPAAYGEFAVTLDDRCVMLEERDGERVVAIWPKGTDYADSGGVRVGAQVLLPGHWYGLGGGEVSREHLSYYDAEDCGAERGWIVSPPEGPPREMG